MSTPTCWFLDGTYFTAMTHNPNRCPFHLGAILREEVLPERKTGDEMQAHSLPRFACVS